MTRRALPAILIGSALVAALSLSSCASGPVQIPPGLSSVEIFQRAQDASDRGDNTLAIRYYSLISSEHPEDVNHLTWASYEIAFLYHKMGKDEVALARVNQLLDQYKTEGDKLPPAPRVLAVKLKARLEAAVKTVTAAAPAAPATPATPGTTDTPAAPSAP
jgi:hypothetical protein